MKLLLAFAISACLGASAAGLTLGPGILEENELAAGLQPEPYKNGRDTINTGIPSQATGLGTAAPKLKKTYESLDYYTNVRLSDGVRFIPPDPSGAAGHSRLVAVTNVAVECRTLGGQLMWEGLIRDIFPNLAESFTFDPKVFYDRHSRRFVIVTLESDRTTNSKIFLAVSKDGNPGSISDFDVYEIDALTDIDGKTYFADYPGFEASKDVIYITNNMFPTHGGFGKGSQVWVIDKSKLYGELVLDYYTIELFRFAFPITFMPAKIAGDKFPEVKSGNDTFRVDTFFVGYSGVSFGGGGFGNGFSPHVLTVLWLADPLGEPFLDRAYVPVLDLECFSFSPLPDAPQAGGDQTIETNDRRALDAVWRDDQLWMTFQTGRKTCDDDPLYTKANYARMNTQTIVEDTFGPSFELVDYGAIPHDNIDPLGEEVATFFPAVAVNRDGEAYFAFSASSPNMFPGAFLAGTDPGTEQCVKEGEAYYDLRFGSSRNRWGDYLGISVDPSNDDFFWVFEQYAALREFNGNERSVWATVWARTTGKESAANNN